MVERQISPSRHGQLRKCVFIKHRQLSLLRKSRKPLVWQACVSHSDAGAPFKGFFHRLPKHARPVGSPFSGISQLSGTEVARRPAARRHTASMRVEAVGQQQHNAHTHRNEHELRYGFAQCRSALHLRHQIADGDVNEP